MSGVWRQAEGLLKRHATRTSRQIADAIDTDSASVSSVLCLMAKRGKVVRVLSAEHGPLRWRLVDARGAK